MVESATVTCGRWAGALNPNGSRDSVSSSPSPSLINQTPLLFSSSPPPFLFLVLRFHFSGLGVASSSLFWFYTRLLDWAPALIFTCHLSPPPPPFPQVSPRPCPADNRLTPSSTMMMSSGMTSLSDRLRGSETDRFTSPLCIEEFDLSDKNFKPCPCGYQVRPTHPNRHPTKYPAFSPLNNSDLQTIDLPVLLQQYKNPQ